MTAGAFVARVLRHAALWFVLAPLFIIALMPVEGQAMPTARQWWRIAAFGVPCILMSGVLDALAEAKPAGWPRALLMGGSFALVIFVPIAAGRIVEGADALRLLRALAVGLPVVTLIMAASHWARDAYLGAAPKR